MRLPTEISLRLANGQILSAYIWSDHDGRGPSTSHIPPIIAFHGWLDNKESFTNLASLFVESGCASQFIAIDLPGHGRSSHRSQDACYDFPRWIPDIAYLLDVILDDLDVDSAFLLGHSLGGAIATSVAAVFPDRVRSLVTVDALGPLTAPDHGVTQQLRHSFETTKKYESRPLRIFPNREAMASRLRAVVPGLTSDAARQLIKGGSKTVSHAGSKSDQSVTWSYDPRLRARSGTSLSEPQVLRLLADIECPVLMIRPEPGYPYDKARYERRIATVPQLTICQLPGPHHVHLTDPESVYEIIRNEQMF